MLKKLFFTLKKKFFFNEIRTVVGIATKFLKFN